MNHTDKQRRIRNLTIHLKALLRYGYRKEAEEVKMLIEQIKAGQL